MALKNLVLDMGNVLLSWEPMAFALRAAGNEEDAKVLYATLFDTSEWAMHDAGEIEEEAVLRSSLLRTPDRLAGTLRTLFDRWPEWMAPIPGADAFTAAAREAGLKLYLLSNAGTRFPAVLKERAFFSRLDGVVVSAHEKVSKPNARIYGILCDRYALNPRECLFVDDLPQNVEGAVRAGMEGHLFDGDYRKVARRVETLGISLPKWERPGR